MRFGAALLYKMADVIWNEPNGFLRYSWGLEMVLSLLVPHIKTSWGLLKSFCLVFLWIGLLLPLSIECLAVMDRVSCVSSSSQQDSFFFLNFLPSFYWKWKGQLKDTPRVSSHTAANVSNKAENHLCFLIRLLTYRGMCKCLSKLWSGRRDDEYGYSFFHVIRDFHFTSEFFFCICLH